MKQWETTGKKPRIGVCWRDDGDQTKILAAVEAGGGEPVLLPQVTSERIGYDAEKKVLPQFWKEGGCLTREAAEAVKQCEYDLTNVAQAMEGIDGVVFPGGKDMSPTLFRIPAESENGGEAISPERDISDYLLMSYCLEHHIPLLGICRGEQVMAIVSGCTIVQDAAAYYRRLGVEYHDEHRLPLSQPGRERFTRHDIEVPEGGHGHMRRIAGGDSLAAVSSWHHQWVDSVEGTNLAVTATATTNGVTLIEAVERTDRAFALGVQFHPENDVYLAVKEGAPREELCDVEVCTGFFRALVEQCVKAE